MLLCDKLGNDNLRLGSVYYRSFGGMHGVCGGGCAAFIQTAMRLTILCFVELFIFFLVTHRNFTVLVCLLYKNLFPLIKTIHPQKFISKKKIVKKKRKPNSLLDPNLPLNRIKKTVTLLVKKRRRKINNGSPKVFNVKPPNRAPQQRHNSTSHRH